MIGEKYLPFLYVLIGWSFDTKKYLRKVDFLSTS